VNVLAIDTSHAVGSVAVAVDGEPTRAAQFGEGSSHLVEIGQAVDGSLIAAGLAAGDIDRVALVRGPGSFTGLRIGMAYAKGLCAGLCTELVVMSTLELLALPLLRQDFVVCALVDARKGEVYGAVYAPLDGLAPNRGTTLVEPCAREPQTFVSEAKGHSPIYLGTGALRYRSVVESVDPGCRIEGESAALPSAALLAEIAPLLDPLSGEELAALEPFYARASDAVFKPLKPIDPHG
jgi:tRNA threonylcarbamoyl adenosine modification protein YeaZ